MAKNEELGYSNLRVIFSQKFILILLMMAMQISLLAQQITVKGKVTDAQGNGIPAVNIMEKGTTRGLVSNNDGDYTITVEP